MGRWVMSKTTWFLLTWIPQREALFVFHHQRDEWRWPLYSSSLAHSVQLFHQFCSGAPQPSCMLRLSLLIWHETGLKVQIEADSIILPPPTPTPHYKYLHKCLSFFLLRLVCLQLLSFLSIRTSGKYNMSSQNAWCLSLFFLFFCIFKHILNRSAFTTFTKFLWCHIMKSNSGELNILFPYYFTLKLI